MNTAWRVWDGEMMYHWDDLGMSLEITGYKWILWHTWNDGSRVRIVESDDMDAVLMWGAGLKDKNGKGIYEKDIDMADEEPMIVVYEDGRFALKFPDDHTYFDDCIDWDKCEILGNVYENHELLEGAE